MATRIYRVLDPEPVARLADHLDRGGGLALGAARKADPAALVGVVERAGLRGRGGAGFPTGRKWRTVAATAADHGAPVVVVNAAEGEPGTFKDRLLLRRNPYRVLEGACIAALAVGADRVVVATKASFRIEVGRLRQAVVEVADAGWAEGFDLSLFEGPDEYLYGEETAMLQAIDGLPPLPRVAPPYRRGLGEVSGPAALVDNVETLANVPAIVTNGAGWFRSLGTEQSPGTVICTVSGDAPRHGVGEFPMGTPLRAVLGELGEVDGGVAAVLSGVSNPPLGPDDLDLPVCYEAFGAVGSGLGSASFIVVGQGTSLRSVAAGVARFLSIESCGQCEPCKRDSLAVAAALRAPGPLPTRPARADATDVPLSDLLATVAIGARCALAGQTERVVGGLLALAERQGMRAADEADGQQTVPIVPLVDLEGTRAVLDLGHQDKRPDWTMGGPAPGTGRWPAQRLADQPVEISLSPTAELDHPGERAGGLAAPEPFASLRRHDRTLDRLCTELRQAADTDERRRAATALRAGLERHMAATQGIVYPLVTRLAVGLDDDVVWYPARHESVARRLLDRLTDGPDLVVRQVDEICADVHVALRELEDRILPCLEGLLGREPELSLELDGDLADVLNER
ncbi:MAG: NADH-ubiquinone oxidoreductase-F iron-sulfur binding region domain-containing protein [Acidimicrobiales bacterium]